MKKFVLLIAVLAYCLQATAQVGINTGNLPPDPSAILDVNSTTRDSLLPRMTHTQIEAISSPANGLQVFCTTDSKIYIFVAAVNLWKEIAYGTGTIALPFSCGEIINDTRDGKSYNTVLIGLCLQPF